MTAAPLDTEGRPIGPLRLHRGLRLNIIAGSLITASFGIISPGAAIMTIFLREHLAASPALIGLNVALFTLGSFLSVFGAPLFNSVKRRRPIWVLMTVLGRALYLPLFIVPLLSSRDELRPYLIALVIGIGAIAMAINGTTSVGWWSWMADLIPESIRGRFFGDRNRVLLIVGALVPLAAGAALDHLPQGPVLVWLFLIAGILAVLDPLLFNWVPEPVRGSEVKKASVRESVRMFLTPLRDKGFRTFLWAIGIRLFAGALPGPFLALYLRGEDVLLGNGETTHVGCDASFFMITLSGAIGTAAGVLSSGWWGRLADKIGHRPVFLVGVFGYVVQLAYGLLTPGNYVWLLPLLNILGNLTGVGAGIALSNLLIGISPKQGREYYVASYTVFASLVMAAAPWIGGIIGKAMPIMPFIMPGGQPATYYHLLIVLSFIIVLFSLVPSMRIPDARGDDVGSSLLKLARGGLVRTIYQLGVIAQTDDPMRRAKALRSMGRDAASVAFEEVAEALDDPSPQVRQEALYALGRMGSEEALELLMWCLQEPDTDTREAAAAALGAMPNRQGVPVLRSALYDADSRVRRAATVALGRLGDPHSLDRLRERLREDPDGEVHVAAARALSYMHDYDSVELLTEGALWHSSRLARSQMTIALGGLFGKAAEFYRLWRRDRQVPGVSFNRLVRRLDQTLVRQLRRKSGRLRMCAECREFRRQFIEDRIKLRSLVELQDWPAVLEIMDRVYCRAASLLAVESCKNVAACKQCLGMMREAAKGIDAQEAVWDGVVLAGMYAMNATLARPGK